MTRSVGNCEGQSTGRAGKRALSCSAHPEDGLHLGQVRPRMRACEHLHDKAAEGPNVGFAGVRGLLDNLGSHPVD